MNMTLVRLFTLEPLNIGCKRTQALFRSVSEAYGQDICMIGLECLGGRKIKWLIIICLKKQLFHYIALTKNVMAGPEWRIGIRQYILPDKETFSTVGYEIFVTFNFTIILQHMQKFDFCPLCSHASTSFQELFSLHCFPKGRKVFSSFNFVNFSTYHTIYLSV